MQLAVVAAVGPAPIRSRCCARKRAHFADSRTMLAALSPRHEICAADVPEPKLLAILDVKPLPQPIAILERISIPILIEPAGLLTLRSVSRGCGSAARLVLSR